MNEFLRSERTDCAVRQLNQAIVIAPVTSESLLVVELAILDCVAALRIPEYEICASRNYVYSRCWAIETAEPVLIFVFEA